MSSISVSQEIIDEIISLIDKNNQIYQRRVKFEGYCKNVLGFKRNLYDFCNYDDFLSYHQERSLPKTLENIIGNKIYLERYYQDVHLEICNNKKILLYIKTDILNYIKTKSMVSVEQILNNNFDFLTDFYIEFFLEGLVQNGYLEKIKMSNIVSGTQNLYKRIEKIQQG